MTSYLAVLALIFVWATYSAALPHPRTAEFAAEARAAPARAFTYWQAYNGKTYSSKEEATRRYAIWQENLEYVNKVNAEGRSYWLAMTPLADKTRDEVNAHLKGGKACTNVTEADKAKFQARRNQMKARAVKLDLASLPASIDWVQKGLVTPAKDQASCGACWAFSVLAAVEAAHAGKTGTLESLSEQHLVDCSGRPNGCKGNSVFSGYTVMMDKGGVPRTYEEPYLSAVTSLPSGSCTPPGSNAVKIDGYVPLEPSEDAILQAIQKQPVVAVVRTGTTNDWPLYGGGVYDGPCGETPDHGIAIVGYGTENGTPYWLIKNSWGALWGQQGFMKIRRNVDDDYGKCGLADYPSVPIMTGFNVPNMPVGVNTTKRMRSFPGNVWTKRLSTYSLSECAAACMKEKKCKYFARLGCEYTFDDGMNCELADNTSPGVDAGAKYCGESGSVPGRTIANTNKKPSPPPPKKKPPKKKKG